MMLRAQKDAFVSLFLTYPEGLPKTLSLHKSFNERMAGKGKLTLLLLCDDYDQVGVDGFKK